MSDLGVSASMTWIKSPLLTGTVKSYSCSSMQFKHWPFASPLNAPPWCCGCISVTLSKHFGHLWGMKRSISSLNTNSQSALRTSIRWLESPLYFHLKALWHIHKTGFRRFPPFLSVINVWPKFNFFKPYYSVFHRKPFEQNTPECLADLPPFE